ncbi:FAD-dependent oxidoreductase family protein [Actinidia rufa]|uniref:FAD-dependent oxidoreductase family protein n=1 Tax=Actinidia rufa TaxID=165716 RepID=A0A7J0H760_9ERIC|nr:FAD-dependent oxidoreductase family protein [Actinidia rufa]
MLVTSPFLISVPSLGQIRYTGTSTVISIRSSSSPAPAPAPAPVPSMEDDSAEASRGLRRRSHRSLHRLLPRQEGRRRHPPRAILRRLRRVGKIWRLPRPRLVRRRAPLRPLPRQLQSSPFPRPRPRRSPILRLPPPHHRQPLHHRIPHGRQNPIPTLPNWVDGPARNPRIIGTTETTSQVHPKLFSRTLLSKAVADGGVEVERGEATAVVIEGGRKIGADAVVLALEPWSGKLSILSSIFRVYGLKAHSVVVEPKEAGAISPHALFLSYKTAQGGEAMDPEVYPRPTETVLSHLRVGEATVKAEQACFLPCTEDCVPVIGEVPGVKVCYVATGHSCWGILNGPATGAAVAELILDGRSSIVDLSPFSPARFIGGR